MSAGTGETNDGLGRRARGQRGEQVEASVITGTSMGSPAAVSSADAAPGLGSAARSAESARWMPRGGTSAGVGTLLAALAVTTVLCVIGFGLKFTCAVPHTGSIPGRVGCYSDLAYFWQARDVVSHQFPYLHGGLTSAGEPYGSVYEYPVLTGVLIWLSSLPASSVYGFLASNAVISLLLACAVTVLLWWQAGRRVWWWAASPALVLYPLLNWDLPAVVCAVAGFAVMSLRGRSLRWRANLAAVAFALGFAFKIYPGFFVLPLLLLVLYGTDGRPTGARWRQALETGALAAAVVVAVNLPFMVWGWDGWWGSIHFQQLRRADRSTNSLWWWGVRPAFQNEAAYDALVSWWSPRLVLLGFLLLGYTGWRVARSRGSYPWVGVSAGMLAVFFVFHKVDSPQYALWLLPVLALLRVSSLLPLGYWAANAGVGVGYWATAVIVQGLPLLLLGVWGQVLLLMLAIPMLVQAHPVAALHIDGSGIASPVDDANR